MNRISVLSVVLAAMLVSSISLAAKDKATATFQSLSASGISGEANLSSMPQGKTKIHAMLQGLAPGTEYVALVYQQNGTCGSGSTTTEVVRFKANPSGRASLNAKVDVDLEQIGSVSVQLVSDNSLLACASVTP